LEAVQPGEPNEGLGSDVDLSSCGTAEDPMSGAEVSGMRTGATTRCDPSDDAPLSGESVWTS
jgi:hypothetical protein